jgi:hypothetical protein
MKPKQEFIQCALNLLIQSQVDGLVVAFHRGDALGCNGLACYRTATFPTGVIRVADTLPKKKHDTMNTSSLVAISNRGRMYP